MRLFLAECPRYLSEIRRVVTNRDPKALEFAAHTLKGSIADLFTRQPFGAASKLVQWGAKTIWRGRRGPRRVGKGDHPAPACISHPCEGACTERNLVAEEDFVSRLS